VAELAGAKSRRRPHVRAKTGADVSSGSNGDVSLPGTYPVIVVGSGPGGLQVSYALSRLGIRHAAISRDPAPGGMFRRFPFFQRMLSWTKPYAPVERGTRAYEWYDWNSLLADEPESRALMPRFMDGTSEFPSRPEMEQNLLAFADKAAVSFRYGCTWERTRREERGFVLETSDGEYRANVVVFAVGVAEPWKPKTPGFEHAPHYADTGRPEIYAGKRLLIVGKQNSGFELANGLLSRASRIILASPRPATLSVNARSLAGIRARYVQPVEDHVVGGGVSLLDASIERIERLGNAYRAQLRRSDTGAGLSVEIDAVIAATGWQTPLRDLPALGVATFGQSGLPAQTAYWESATVPGIYFAGTINQGAVGLKKYGAPSNSGAVHGYRYNARVLAVHIARVHFGATVERPRLAADTLVDYLLDEATLGPELWNQRAYLARVVTLSADDGIRDGGIVPLAAYVDEAGPDSIAITVETDAEGDIHPAAYLRRGGRVQEQLLESDPLLDFRTPSNRRALESLLGSLI
jgi:thioredoxin reductase